MRTALFLGTAKVDISPREPVQLCGFAARKRTGYEAKDSPIHARFFYFRQPDGTLKGRQVLLVSADLIFWESGFSQTIREKISSRWNVPYNAVILHATHSHSGPATGEFVELGDPDPDYLQWLQQEILEGVGPAIANAEQVTIRRGSGHSGIGVNRRKEVNGTIVNAPNFEGLTDPEVQVIEFVTLSGHSKAILMHYTCHPTITSENRLSYEYCGVAVEKVERHVGGAVVAGFLQGCCGEVNPLRDGPVTGFAAIRNIGEELAGVVTGVLEENMLPQEPSALQASRHTVEIPYSRVPSREELKNKQAAGTELEKKWSTHLLNHPDKLRPCATLEVTKVELADRLSMVFMNGEISLHYGLFIKEQTGGAALPVAYTNGIIGYVMTARQLDEGGYEPIDSVTYYGLPAPYGKESEPIILDRLKQIIS